MALVLDPAHDVARAEIVAPDARARLDGAPVPPAPTPGTPEHVAWAVIDALGRGDFETAWTKHMDSTVAEALLAGQAPAERAKNEADFVRGAVKGFEESASLRMLGWELPPAEPMTGHTAHVVVRLLLESTPSAEKIEDQIRLVYSPLGEKVLDPTVVKVCRALPREDVERASRRMAGRATRTVSEGRFDLVRRGAEWKVADASCPVPAISPSSSQAARPPRQQIPCPPRVFLR